MGRVNWGPPDLAVNRGSGRDHRGDGARLSGGEHFAPTIVTLTPGSRRKKNRVPCLGPGFRDLYFAQG